MRNAFSQPAWSPAVEPGARILVAGASGGIGKATAEMLLSGPACAVGAHFASGEICPVEKPSSQDHQLIPLKRTLVTEQDCANLVDEFVRQAEGIDGLVVMTGGLSRNAHFSEIAEEDWLSDIGINLNVPFFLARAAMAHMKQADGGRIVLAGSESSLHGGSASSLGYGVSKRGIECLVQGLARDGAENNILVNGMRLGHFNTDFNKRWKGTDEAYMDKRADMIPLKRGGDPMEAAALIIYLLSGWGSFITGQMIPITGGDWL